LPITLTTPTDEDVLQRLEESAADHIPPPVLMLRRKSVRMYGVDRGVALYFADQLNRYISITFGSNSLVVENVALNPIDFHPAWQSILSDHFRVVQNVLKDTHKKKHRERAGHYDHLREIKRQYNQMAGASGANQRMIATFPIKEELEDVLDEIAGAYVETLTEDLQLDEASRWKIVKARIRNGKIQRRKKVSTVPGFTFRQKGASTVFMRIPSTERIRRRIGARRAKIKRRAKMSRTKQRQKRSMMKRNGLGL
jgi:hypothetical protein